MMLFQTRSETNSIKRMSTILSGLYSVKIMKEIHPKEINTPGRKKRLKPGRTKKCSLKMTKNLFMFTSRNTPMIRAKSQAGQGLWGL